MEGKVGSDPRRLAYEEYMNSKDKARYTSLAQKLAQHINHLAEDKNTRIRWIWELIQNAKDVPNEFGRCRIRIEIKDDKLIFAHNGDPFRVSDLQSLVAQYSSKAQQNKLNTETTGKYGTGFIVTYILSKKIRIKGLLSMKTHQEQLATKKNQSQEEDNVQLSSEEQISNTKSKVSKKQFSSPENEQQHSLQEHFNIQEHVQKLMPKKSKLKNFQGGSLYQRFDIFLDRDYKDRDKELFFKLMMTQRNLMEDLLKIQPEPKWQRKQGQLNTQFIYQDIDQAANKMINESMGCLKELFPYALLFNPKLFQIQVIDKRTHKSIKKFGIKRLPQESFNGLKIFNANILEQGSQTAKKFSLAYIEDEDTYSTIAIPLQIKQNSIKLLEINNKFPKMFKEFPLIGCKDTGFNFAFTSKRFYPNENRSNLLLQQIQGRDSKKTKANWQALLSIFQKGLQLYIKVSNLIDAGQQNLFIVSMQNQFTQPVYKNKNMYQIYKRYQQEVTQMQCIEFRNKSKGTIKELTFPFGKSENKKVDDQKYCSIFNSAFALILGDENTLSDQNYKRFYHKFQTYQATWSEFKCFPDVKGCISQLSKLKFAEILYKVKGNRETALSILEKIYDFLHHNHPSYVTKEQKKGNKRQWLKFILTNGEQFRDISQYLAVKKDLPQAYEEIGRHLGIIINQFTIYDKFTKYFIDVKNFGLPQMLHRFENYFFFNTSNNPMKSLELLGRFITTFKTKSEAIEIAKKLKHFENVDKPFQLKDQKASLILDNRVKNEFRLLFEISLVLHINKLMQENEALSKLMLLTQFIYPDTQKAIQWLNVVFKFQENLLKQSKSKQFMKGYTAVTSQSKAPTYLIQRNLSLSMKFVSMQQLKCFSILRDQKYFKGNYPDSQDLAMYEKMRNIYNRRSIYVIQNKKFELQPQILHESITYKLPIATTFNNEFTFIIDIYNYYNKDYLNYNSNVEEKLSILNYVFHLRQAAIKNRQLQFKIHVFRDLEKKAYYLYPNLTNCIQRPENQIYAFALVKNQQELSAARQISEQYGSLKKVLEQLKSLKAKEQQTGEK